MKNPIEITEPDGVVWVNGEAQHGSLLYEDGEILIKTKEIITRPTNETELFYQVTYKKFPDKDGDIQSIKLEKPKAVFIDEGHNIESLLCDIYSESINSEIFQEGLEELLDYRKVIYSSKDLKKLIANSEDNQDMTVTEES